MIQKLVFSQRNYLMSIRAFSKTMRAITFDNFGEADVLKISDKVDIPQCKNKDQVLLKIEATAVNRADIL